MPRAKPTLHNQKSTPTALGILRFFDKASNLPSILQVCCALLRAADKRLFRMICSSRCCVVTLDAPQHFVMLISPVRILLSLLRNAQAFDTTKVNMEMMYDEIGGGWKGKAKRREMKTPFMHYLIATESPAQLPADANAGTAAAQPPPLGFVSLLFDVEDGCEVGYVSPHFSSVLVSSTRNSQLAPCTTAHTL